MAKKKSVFKKKMSKVGSEFQEGSLHSGSKQGPIVTSRAQEMAIALSVARKAAKKKKKDGK